jgi:tRNA nucleotidyltransferase/poly(A) polymerase
MDRLREGANQVAEELRAAGYEVYFAGGCVRDLLRGTTPKDYDIVTNATPDEVMKLFRRTVAVGAQFGVVRVLIDRGREYEVATYRTDVEYSDGRHPDKVAYSSSKEEDVKRRDFTINALLMNPTTDEVIDLVGGQADLKTGIIRAVGDPELRFAEDRLRMLRAVRFASRFGFAIDPATLRAIEKHAGAIDVVSVERIVVELRGIFASKAPEVGYRLLVESGLWAAVLPYVPASEVLAERFGRLFVSARELTDEARALVAFAIVMEGSGLNRDALDERLRGLKLSAKDLKLILRIVTETRAAFGKIGDLVPMIEIAIDPERDLFRAYVSAMFGDISEPVHALDRIEKDIRAHPLPPLPLITGADLKALGIPEGPEYKSLLAGVRGLVLLRRITTKDEALAWVKANRH